MTRALLIALAAVVVVAGPAFAGGGPGHGRSGHGGFGHGGHGHGDRLRSSLPTRVFPHHHHQRHFNGQRFGHGQRLFPYGGGYGVFAPPVIGYGATYAVPEYVLPPPAYTTAYRWVWVPNPPPSPPAVESAAPPPPPAPPAEREPVRSLEFYRWTDAEGVTHFSDRLEHVPEPYRSTVTKSRT